MSGNYTGCSWQANTLITCLFFKPKFQKLFIFVIKKCFDIKYRFLNFFIVSGGYYFKDANASFYLYPTTQFFWQSFCMFSYTGYAFGKGTRWVGLRYIPPYWRVTTLFAHWWPMSLLVSFLFSFYLNTSLHT